MSLVATPLPLTIALVLAVWLWKRLLAHRTAGDITLLPEPPESHWLWGHDKALADSYFGKKYGEWFDAFGSNLQIRGPLGHGKVLLTNDPSVISHIYSRNAYNYVKGDASTQITELIVGRGLLWAEGQTHKRQRALLNPAFIPEKIRAMAPAIFEVASRMESRLTQRILASDDRSVRINALRMMSEVTLDVIGRVGFGHDFDGGRSTEAKEIIDGWIKQEEMSITPAGFIGERLLRTFPWIARLPLEAINEQKRFRMLIRQLASNQFVNRDTASEDNNDLLSILLKADSNNIMTRDEILDQIVLFVIAGHETTSGVIACTLYELARAPEKQARLREELVAFGSEPTYDTLQTSLPYLDAVCKEGLRLYPAAPRVERTALQDDVIPLKTPVVTKDGKTLTEIKVSAGQVILTPPIGPNRSNAIWGDGDTFRPERWLPPNTPPAPSTISRGFSNTFTFMEGPRMCIGYRLAILEIKVFLSTIVRNFVLHKTEAVLDWKIGYSMHPRIYGREEEGIQLPLLITMAE